MKPTKQDIKRDIAYREWVRTQPCHMCGGYSEYLENGDKKNHAAHVRHNSGIGTKPLFSAVPLCVDCHHRQHTKGHEAMMPMDNWVKLAKLYVKRWRDEQI